LRRLSRHPRKKTGGGNKKRILRRAGVSLIKRRIVGKKIWFLISWGTSCVMVGEKIILVEKWTASF